MGLLIAKADECGMKLNKEKCNILVFNNTNTRSIEDIKIVSEMTYLGVKINNKKSWYIEQVNESIDNGTRISNYLYSILGATCNKLMIGKAFWKSVALPRILYGQEVLTYRSGDLNRLQMVEDKSF